MSFKASPLICPRVPQLSRQIFKFVMKKSFLISKNNLRKINIIEKINIETHNLKFFVLHIKLIYAIGI